jgi:hypothetical protein
MDGLHCVSLGLSQAGESSLGADSLGFAGFDTRLATSVAADACAPQQRVRKLGSAATGSPTAFQPTDAALRAAAFGSNVLPAATPVSLWELVWEALQVIEGFTSRGGWKVVPAGHGEMSGGSFCAESAHTPTAVWLSLLWERSKVLVGIPQPYSLAGASPASVAL